MIKYASFTLENGLQVLVHEDSSTPMAVVNVLYNVGSRDEDKNKTGFAHLFEHLMFGGSINIPSYDAPLQKVGGENNAFTSTDITNYYITIPAQNIETAFWLESDRMLSLAFTSESLEIQRKVVIEEFKQRYLNQPYGNMWLKMRPLAYKTHPYRWATIGEKIEHIEHAKMDDVKAFFRKFYVPNNAILVVAGNVKLHEIKKLVEKWFASIPSGDKYKRVLPKEPIQKEARFLEVQADVPLNAIYKAYHMAGRGDLDFYSADLISDILGRGNSSRLYKKLVKQKPIFTEINAYVTGSLDPGLLMISGKINEEVSINEADNEIENVIKEFQMEAIKEEELEKVKNQAEASLMYSEVELLNRAVNLAFFANMGDPNQINKEGEKIQGVSTEKIYQMTNTILDKKNASTIYYKKK